MRHVLRTTDVLARPGGDEFVTLLTNTPLDGARIAAERLHTALREPIVVNGMELSIDASFGIAEAHPDDNAESLLHKADQARYEAKRGGGGVVAYQSSSRQT